MCLSGQDTEDKEEEEEEVKAEVRLPVAVNDSSTQQHCLSQASIFLSFEAPFSTEV